MLWAGALTTPPPPPPGLDVELTHDGFQLRLAPARTDVSPWLSTVAEARMFGLWLIAVVVFGGFGLLVLEQVGNPSGLDIVLLGLKVSVLLAAGPVSYLLFDHTVLRRRWELEVDTEVLRLTPVVLGRRMRPRVLPLETVRDASVVRGPPHELVVQTTRGRHLLRTAQKGAELDWIVEAIRYARHRKAEFWREVLKPSRLRDRQALGQLTGRD